MKKVFTLLLCLCMLLSLLACGKQTQQEPKEKIITTELAMDKTFSITDFAEFSIFKIFTTPKITPTMGGFYCFNNDREGETYIDVILEWKNTSGRGLDSSELISFTASNDKGQEYKQVFYTIETANCTDLSQHVDIEPNSTVRLHCALSVPETETTLKLKFKRNKQEFTYTYTLGTTLSVAEPVESDMTITAPNHADFTLVDVMYTDDVLPSNTEGQYYHYTIKDPANTYLVIKFDITNLQGTAVNCDKFVNINVVYQNKYTYTGSVYVENGDGTGFNPGEDLIPLATRHLYYLIEVPKSVTENEANITIAFAEKEYIYTFLNEE